MRNREEVRTCPLPPRSGALFVVRWLRTTGDTTHRYYRRRCDALAFAERLAGYGIAATVHEAVQPVSWREVTR